MKYTVYDSATGQILHTISASDSATLELNLQNQPYVEGSWAGDQYYVNNGQVISIPTKPVHENYDYQFDWTTKTWQIDPTLSEVKVTQQRDSRLEPVTAVSAVQYSLLTTQQQQELQTYYQALLAVTSQPGFPATVVWPTKPGWL